jgi:hypothetical protein
MAVNHHIQGGLSIGRSSEQLLMEDLILESIKFYGFDLMYLPRKTVNENDVLNEDVLNTYSSSHTIEMYLNNVDGFGGDSTLFSKFGLEIRDSASFLVSKRRWHELVGRHAVSQLTTRPTEGDILYFPLTKSFFEIRKVDAKNPFFQVGKLYTYRLDCELYQFSHERFGTGIKEIDEITKAFSTDINLWGIELEENEGSILMETMSQSKLIKEEFIITNIIPNSQNEDFTNLNSVLDFSCKNPFGEPIK